MSHGHSVQILCGIGEIKRISTELSCHNTVHLVKEYIQTDTLSKRYTFV